MRCLTTSAPLLQFREGTDRNGLVRHDDGLDGLLLFGFSIISIALPLQRAAGAPELDGPIVATSTLGRVERAPRGL